MSNMANPIVSQARSFQENPRHYPRKLQVGVYNFFSKRIPYKSLPANPKKILIQAQEKIGDAVLLFPTISGLRKLFPESVIHLLCSRINEPLFQSIKEVEKTMVYRSGRQFWNALKETKYDLFYNPKDHPSITAFKISKNVRADVKVCIAHRRMEQHYNHGLTLNNTYRILEKNSMILRAYDLDFTVKSFFPNTELNSPKNENQISINLSSGSEFRKWSLENWITLISVVLKKNKHFRINLFANGKDLHLAKQIEKQFSSAIKLIHPLYSILEAGPIIQNSNLLISPDTAMIHIADAVGTPMVGLFSGDDRNVRRYRPYWVKYKILQSSTLSIQGIEPNEVFNAFEELMN